MSEQNVLKFDEIAGKLLRYLALTFPIPSDVGPSSLSLAISEKGTYNPESGDFIGREPPSQDEEVFYATVEWFLNSGYIYATKSSHQFGYTRLVLTEKGLHVLGVKPEALKAK